MIPEKIQALFDFIDYLDQRKSEFIDKYPPLCDELSRLDIQRSKLKPRGNYIDKQKYDEIQNTITEKFKPITQNIYIPVLNRLRELKIWSGDDVFTSIWNNNSSAIHEFKENFETEDIPKVLAYKQKYLCFREDTNSNFFACSLYLAIWMRFLKSYLIFSKTQTGLSKVYPKTSINGSQISRFDFHLSPHYLMFSVNFQPSALTRFLKLPLTEFIDERIDAEAILNPEIHQLHDKLVNVNSYDSIVEMVEQYLWKRIQSLKTYFHPIEKVAQIISEKPNSFNVEKMASFACLSISQFERKFMQQMGITPKFYARINRFYQAYQIKDKNPKADWLSIALETGYHDYQHLVKDFKQFSDTSPHSLLEAQAKSPERILRIA